MRVALVHVRHAHTGGTERFLNLISRHLAEQGHEPVIVCRRHEEPPDARVRFELLRPFSLGPTARMWKFARAVEAHVYGTDYDVVFGLGKTWTHDVVRMGGGCHATYLESAHDATLTPFERWIGKGRRKHARALEIERRALAPSPNRMGGEAPHVVTNSKLVKRDVIQRYALPEERVTVIYNGVDTERFHPRQRSAAGAELRASLGLRPDDQVVLFLGTGYGRKGLDRVLRACAELVPDREALRLMIVGYDSAQAHWVKRAAELGIGERCLFLGGRRDAEVCYGAADVYVLPTRYDPFANSTLEAMASGLPTITTPSNGGSELIEEGLSGSVLPPGDAIAELARALGHWLDHRDAGGEAARTTAQIYDSELMVNTARELLENIHQLSSQKNPR